MQLKVLIADDDDGMRLMLKKVIDKTPGFVLAGEAADGEEALRLFALEKPRVVFLDIDMPRMNGIECANKISELSPSTFFIFATAHEEYMDQAFQVYAADYIIKPFKIERIMNTLERIRGFNQPEQTPVSIVRAVRPSPPLGKLMIRNKEGLSFVNTEEIILIQREDRSTVIICQHERLQTSEGLGDIEEKLKDGSFFRCHKSYIINLSMIHKIYPYGRWTYLVKFKNSDLDALMTHDKFEDLQKIF